MPKLKKYMLLKKRNKDTNIKENSKDSSKNKEFSTLIHIISQTNNIINF